VTPKKKNSNNKTDISRWYYCCIFGKEPKIKYNTTFRFGS